MEAIINRAAERKETIATSDVIKKALKNGLESIVRDHAEKVMINKNVPARIKRIFMTEFRILDSSNIMVKVCLRNTWMKFGYCEVTFWMDDKFQMDEDLDNQYITVFGCKEI